MVGCLKKKEGSVKERSPTWQGDNSLRGQSLRVGRGTLDSSRALFTVFTVRPWSGAERGPPWLAGVRGVLGVSLGAVDWGGGEHTWLGRAVGRARWVPGHHAWLCLGPGCTPPQGPPGALECLAPVMLGWSGCQGVDPREEGPGCSSHIHGSRYKEGGDHLHHQGELLGGWTESSEGGREGGAGRAKQAE